MTEQDKNYVIEALEYALHKCIDVNGDSETHYNTLANAIDVVKNCSIPAVVGRSEQLVCDVCGSTDVIEAPHMGRNCNQCHPL